MASLSDEETARALCAFQHTEPLPTQRRQPLQQPLRSTMPHLAPDGLATFGYPSNSTTYHMVPMSRRNEAASVLMGMHTPSTSSGDWQRLQQRAIQDQIEQQQRELQQQMQQQQRREMHVQLQEQTQVQRIQQAQYATGAEFEQKRWRDEVTTSLAMSNFRGGGSQEMQQRRRVYEGRYGRSQVPIRPATVSTPAASFVPEYTASSQPGVTMTRSNDMFTPQQIPQSAQSLLQTRNGENVETSVFHQWQRKDTNGIPTDRTKVIPQRYMPQQPQPYYPITGREQSRETMTHRETSRSFLNGVLKDFPSSTGYRGSPPISFDASAGFNYAEARTNKPLFSLIPTGLQEQMNIQPRPSVPPAGSAVIPGVALASPSVRLLSMRDILNDEEVSNKVDMSRNQQRGGKQKRDPPKRKNPRKQFPSKRRKMPQQVNKQRSQPLQSNRPAGGMVPKQVASPTPSRSVIKPTTPMYRAFMESRAARASEQATGITNTSPPIPSVLPTHETQLPTKSDSRMNVLSANFISSQVNTKVDIPSQRYYSSNMQQPIISKSALPENVTKLKNALHNPECSATESLQKDSERQVQANGSAHCVDDFDNSMEQASEQHLQHPPQITMSTTTVVRNQASTKLDGVGSSKASMTSKKRRRPFADSAGNQQQHAPTVPSSAQGLSKVETAATAPISFSVTQTPAVSDLPRVQNRTVVIFCKRDFMRYQAAKIWRKYQEQLKKHEEWREVRVAGKRTRYLNSRYDELQRTHKRSYTRSGKPRRKASQAAKGTHSHKESTESALVGFTRVESLSGPVDKDGQEICTTTELDPKGSDDSAGSGTLSYRSAHSLNGNPCASDNDGLSAPFSSNLPQQLPLQTEGKIKGTVVLRDSRHIGLGESMAHSGLDDSIEASVHNSDIVADALPSDDMGSSGAIREVIPIITNAAPDNVDPSVAGLSSSAEVTDAVTTVADGTPITKALSTCRIDVTSPELDSSIGTAATVAAPSSNGSIKVADSAPHDIPGDAIGDSESVDVVVPNMGVKETTDKESEGSLSDIKRLGEEILPVTPATNAASTSTSSAVGSEANSRLCNPA